eukprot:COSAG01_NODE_3145_length_6516_cov_55.678560_3_plen_178_part_00
MHGRSPARDLATVQEGISCKHTLVGARKMPVPAPAPEAAPDPLRRSGGRKAAARRARQSRMSRGSQGTDPAQSVEEKQVEENDEVAVVDWISEPDAAIAARYPLAGVVWICMGGAVWVAWLLPWGIRLLNPKCELARCGMTGVSACFHDASLDSGTHESHAQVQHASPTSFRLKAAR